MLSYQLPFSQSRISRGKESIRISERNMYSSDLLLTQKKGDLMNYVNRKYKDTLFRLLFSERKHLLSLYNAVNETNYTNEEDLEINTLENVIYLKMKMIFPSCLDSP